MNEAVFHDTPYIETGHHSLPKHLANAELATQFSQYALLISRMAATALSALEYKPFVQVRIGKDGLPFYMPKLQTLPSIDQPHRPENRKNLPVLADFVRRFGFDEFIQIHLVSRDPEAPGLMSMVSHRPQTQEELDDMEWEMGLAGKSARFNHWYDNIYCTKMPGVIGIESFLDHMHEPATLEYYDKRVQLGMWYHEFGSPAIDVKVVNDVISLGSASLQHYIANCVNA